MNANERDRRRFLKKGAALAGLALGAVRSPEVRGQAPGSELPAVPAQDRRAYGVRSRFETSERSAGHGSAPGPHTHTPLQDLHGIITPSGLHYEGPHRFAHADLDPREHRLLIHGMVDRPLIFTLEELKRLPSVSRIYFIECNANTAPSRGRGKAGTVQHSHGMTSCSEWTGVLLSLLLREAGAQKGANWIVAEGAETVKYTMNILLEKAMEDCLVAYGQNGEAVRPEQGYPLRLVVPGWEGPRNVKWLRRIKVGSQPYISRLEASANPRLRPDGTARWFEFEYGPKSVITLPSGGQRLPGRGFYEITGLAWSGGGAIRRVEVSTDGGRSWKDAQLQEPVLRFAHTRFRFPWTWNGEEAVLQSRSTDERGTVQPSLAELGEIYGVKSDYSAYFLSGSADVHHFNPIFPWRVTREGSVQNALFS